MRPIGKFKLGYYPTPEVVCKIINTWVKASEKPGRFLDPCAGIGDAALIMGPAMNCEAWGVELSPQRADEAAKVMDKCLQAPWSTVTLSNSCITVNFCNPPYDNDKEFKRLEWEFLKTTVPKIIPGGLLIYIIPQRILGMENIAKTLSKEFENINVFRFPDGLFEVFNQIVVMATKRMKPLDEPDMADVHDLGMRSEGILPPLEPVDEPVYQLLEAPTKTPNGRPIIFRRNDLQDDEIIAEIFKNGVLKRKDWADMMDPNRHKRKLETPLMPLKIGHLAMLVASGMMGTIRLVTEDGSPILIKGRVVKTIDKSVEVKSNGDMIEKFKDKFVTSVAVIQADGSIEVIKDVKELSVFMEKYGEQIAEHIMNTHKPLYNFDPTPQESAILDTLGKNRKPLPGQAEPGLLPAQRHAAAALARSIKKSGTASIQGEMGVGKTAIGLAVAELVNAYPAIVLCPPHLVPKWIREISVVPGAYGRELCKIGQLSDDDADVNDVRVFLEDYAKAEKYAKEHNQPRPKWFAVVAHTSAKFGGTWEPIGINKHVYHRDSEVMSKYYTCPNCGKVIMLKGKEGGKDPLISLSEISKKRVFCDNMIKGWKLDNDGHRVYDEEGNPIWDERPCGTPLFSFQSKRRYSIAEYINKHHKGAFKILLADEAHQFKSKSSDRGQAFYHLVKACDATLTLTGTYFGGKSTSIFWLLHRLNHGVREDFGFHEEKRWAMSFGVLETRNERKASDVVNEDAEEDGVFTGNRRYQNRAQEKPGISPAVIARLLDTNIFISLKDLQLGLPPYNEEVSIFDMDSKQSRQYNKLAGDLKDKARQNYRYLSTYLQWALGRPNSGFRDEKVIIDEYDKGTGICIRDVEFMNLPKVVNDGEWLKKEDWLANYCLSERQKGRKVLVYVRQTGTRDIQDRVKASLQRKGIRSLILKSNVNARKREAYIESRSNNIDVLITNPKLVETGLDLVQFSTIVFYEIEYSLYTLWQSLRRVWRLGQSKPVKAVFAVYKDTVESAALSLIGSKMKAAMLLYGEEVAGALVPEDDGDILTSLARNILHRSNIQDLQSLFSEDAVSITHNQVFETVPQPASDPAPTIDTISWTDWISNSGVCCTNRKKSGGGKAPEGQLSLF